MSPGSGIFPDLRKLQICGKNLGCCKHTVLFQMLKNFQGNVNGVTVSGKFCFLFLGREIIEHFARSPYVMSALCTSVHL